MPTNECLPYYESSDLTFEATAAVVGKRFVAPSGNRQSGPGLSTTSEGGNYRMAHCGAGLRAAGVSGYDTAINKKGVVEGQPGKIVPVTSGAAIAAGQEVQSDAVGKAVPVTTGRPVGLAMTGVGAVDLNAEIRLY